MTDPLLIGRRASDHVCVAKDQKQGVDSCAPGRFCIDNSVNPSQCIDLEQPPSSTLLPFVGRLKNSQVCSQVTEDSGEGVTYCKKQYCIYTLNVMPKLNSCELLTASDPTKIGKNASDMTCSAASIPGMIECAPYNCIVSTTSTMCESLNVTTNRYGKELDTHLCLDINQNGNKGTTECVLGYYCMTATPGTITAKCVALSSSVTIHTGRETTTQLCLPNDNPGTKGAQWCAPKYCVHLGKCTFMSAASTFIGRKALDHTCVQVNDVVGVDECADSQYCID